MSEDCLLTFEHQTTNVPEIREQAIDDFAT